MSISLSNSPALLPVKPHLTAHARWGGVECRISREDISAGTDWAIHEARHAIIVHLDGAIPQLETELAGCGALLEPPMVGEMWLVPAQSRYASRARGQVVQYAELFVEPAYLQELCGQEVELTLTPRAGQFDGFLHQAVRYLAPLLNQTDDLSRLTCQTLAQTLCLHLARVYGGRPPELLRAASRPTGLAPRTSRQIEEFIAAHLGETITLETLARLAGLSTHQLLDAFRRAFGVTPAQYVIAQRLRRARWLLTSTAKDITTIALETGFASHSHFSTTFKKHTQLTPQAFRAAHTHRG